MRKLFLSFSGLLYNLRDNKVTREDLDTGLFYFGCTLDHVMTTTNGDVERAYRNDPVEGRRAHALIREAIGRAMTEGRAVFRRNEKDNTKYSDLNTLLLDNGFSALVPKGDEYSDFSKPGVDDQVRRQGLALEVIWRG